MKIFPTRRWTAVLSGLGILFLVKNGTWYGCAGRLPRAALSGSRCLMCPEYEYINLDVGSPGTGELSKALPKIERTARLVQESTGLLFRYIPNGWVPLAVPCFWQSSCGASGGQRQAGCQLTFTVCLYAGGGCFLFRNWSFCGSCFHCYCFFIGLFVSVIKVRDFLLSGTSLYRSTYR